MGDKDDQEGRTLTSQGPTPSVFDTSAIGRRFLSVSANHRQNIFLGRVGSIEDVLVVAGDESVLLRRFGEFSLSSK
ncbi:hypothetical protein BIW11_08619 [Tropilaelaps mercedesae]|uniref:Uncharacterized protein n=1 Tax=Tropilaelaps mercedesae TaxID=418985 RepID=A0A1V9XP81_9ACAR|nr:hypothetical protein BIW11_08619 [Tropilaelaps mercedesae]